MQRAGSSRPAWDGVKSMMGMQSKKSHVSLNGRPDLVLSNELNTFYNRFNNCNFSEELSVFKNAVSSQNSVVDRSKVCKLFRGVKERKSPGPDGIGGRVLKNCADQLADIFTFIFSMSLQLHKVPSLWKDFVPVPKSASPTSLVMKSFEKIVKETLLTCVQDKLDPLQFAYRSGRGVEDALATLLNLVLTHLEGAKTFARLLFIDFSSAFNCIQPHILAERLRDLHSIDPGLIA